MTQIKIKRVYEDPEAEDGYRVLVDRLWPRGMKKEHLKYDVWEKDITPSPELRKWFHEDPVEHWEGFSAMYRKELETSEAARNFLTTIRPYKTVTLLYAPKSLSETMLVSCNSFWKHILGNREYSLSLQPPLRLKWAT